MTDAKRSTVIRIYRATGAPMREVAEQAGVTVSAAHIVIDQHLADLRREASACTRGL